MPTPRFPDSATGPGTHGFAITPHNTDALPIVTRQIYVGTGGDLVVRFRDSDADVTLVNVADGTQLDYALTHVRATGTTAADIVGIA